MRSLLLCGAFLGVITLMGCGGDTFNRQPVSGTVSINGKMIPYGNIEFVPQEKQNTSLTLDIRDGVFKADKSRGLTPGKYIIRVQGTDIAPPPPGDAPGTGPAVPQPKSIVPPKFGPESKEEVTIKSGDKNELKIELKG